MGRLAGASMVCKVCPSPGQVPPDGTDGSGRKVSWQTQPSFVMCATSTFMRHLVPPHLTVPPHPSVTSHSTARALSWLAFIHTRARLPQFSLPAGLARLAAAAWRTPEPQPQS